MDNAPPETPQASEEPTRVTPIPWDKLVDDPQVRTAIAGLIADVRPFLSQDLLPFFGDIRLAKHESAGRAGKWTLIVSGGLVGLIVVAVFVLLWFGKLSSEIGGVLFGSLVTGGIGFLRDNGPWWSSGNDDHGQTDAGAA